jgi:hypothetical protein
MRNRDTGIMRGGGQGISSREWWTRKQETWTVRRKKEGEMKKLLPDVQFCFLQIGTVDLSIRTGASDDFHSFASPPNKFSHNVSRTLTRYRLLFYDSTIVNLSVERKVVLHNGGFCIACITKRCIRVHRAKRCCY